MIKFIAGDKENPIFGFGLSWGNIIRLMNGQPILVDLAEMGQKGTVVIFYGTDEQSMEDELRKHGLISKDTVFIQTLVF